LVRSYPSGHQDRCLEGPAGRRSSTGRLELQQFLEGAT
jgi:hypothetical protein